MTLCEVSRQNGEKYSNVDKYTQNVCVPINKGICMPPGSKQIFTAFQVDLNSAIKYSGPELNKCWLLSIVDQNH